MNEKFSNIPELPSIKEISVDLPAVSESCSASRLPDLFRDLESDTLPVINNAGKLTGIISEYDLAKIIAEWSFDDESYLHEHLVSSLMTRNVWKENVNANISDLLSKLGDMHTRVVPLVENDGTYTGKCITRSEIVNYLTQFVKPHSLGGLATPLGVYITDGKHQAGVGNFGLFLTGLVLGSIIYAVQFVSYLAAGAIGVESVESQHIPLVLIGQIFLFLVVLRFTPLAKIHAAEHKTINAIEKGMVLTPETVKMQPKEHLRCGTNLMALILGIQMVILVYATYLNFLSPVLQFIFLFIGFSFVFSNWRKGGILIQKYFTTVSPPDKYIMSGIKAGEEILRKNKEDKTPGQASFGQKIWNMGVVQIIFGFIIANSLFSTLESLLVVLK
ncbi:MAG: DUF1385 domain-containing protein [Candidatus Gastranaerophilales bacterium]|nr:DUF1385 domain-containing protein [Candidatus Gastranaerophilales bacterium]